MKVKNSTILNASDTINNMSLRTSDIKKRWELARLTRPILEASELIRVEINKIIEAEGTLENCNKKINSDNHSYLELMGCECDLDVKINLELLQYFSPNVYELIILEIFFEDK